MRRRSYRRPFYRCATHADSKPPSPHSPAPLPSLVPEHGPSRRDRCHCAARQSLCLRASPREHRHRRAPAFLVLDRDCGSSVRSALPRASEPPNLRERPRSTTEQEISFTSARQCCAVAPSPGGRSQICSTDQITERPCCGRCGWCSRASGLALLGPGPKSSGSPSRTGALRKQDSSSSRCSECWKRPWTLTARMRSYVNVCHGW